ncbi:MAG: energy-converting hydrogenase B subunit EhbP [Candidatus Altiarchaeota archaeon]
MPKIVIESGMVINLGGYIVERTAKFDCIDVILGSPLKEDIKINAPIYNKAMLDECTKAGLIIEYVNKGDSLKDKLEQVKRKVDEALGKVA